MKYILIILLTFAVSCSKDDRQLKITDLEKMAVYKKAYYDGFIDATLGYEHQGYDSTKLYDDYEWYAKSYVRRINEFEDSLRSAK